MLKQLLSTTIGKGLWAIAVVAIAVGVIAAGRPLSSADAGDLQALDLEGTNWVLVSVADEEVLPGTEVTARFDEGRVGGSASCNGYFAGYELDGDALTVSPVGMTMMMCPGPDGVMQQEGAFARALASAQSYRIAGSTLEIAFDGGSLLFTAR